MINRDSLLLGAFRSAGEQSSKAVDVLMREGPPRSGKDHTRDAAFLRQEAPGNVILDEKTLANESTAGRGYALEDDDAGRWLREREVGGAETSSAKVRVALSRLGGSKVPAKDIVAKVKLKPHVVKLALEHLQRDGVVRREGATKNATYDLVA